ncbi:MAG: ferrous iron transport protein B, partial [Bacteroidales bacterium]|nr:ferrous iron transport protein B [Bacteroidales bacterium]
MTLDELQTGKNGIVVKVKGRGVFRKRIMDMGFVRGTPVTAVRNAPLKDPVEYRLMDYNITLRRTEARLIEVIPLFDERFHDTDTLISPPQTHEGSFRHHHARGMGRHRSTGGHGVWRWRHRLFDESRRIEVALVGNPNCGKTSIFNLASKAREHVGNYAGVTVGSKMAEFNQGGYTFILTDLPGTYSLSTYSPEELFVRHHMTGNTPDVVINVIDASNLERNFYLTTQLIDMDVPMVIALNMYDELQQTGNKFDYEALSTMLGVPIVPTIGTKGEGIRELFNRVADLYEGRDSVYRHIHITYHTEIEQSIHILQDLIWKLPDFSDRLSSRFFAIKLLEKDVAARKELEQLGNTKELWQQCDQETDRLEHLFGDDTESLITDGRYGFIHGALRETLRQGPKPVLKEQTPTERLDRILTHKWFGFPLFLLFLWIMFQSTFNLGKFPVAWIDAGVGALSGWLSGIMPPGILKDLLVDGIIGGVGGVIVFLPNIMILFLFISLMEDSGYMARVAFIMDKLMHVLGLHGKSFIPLIMGFGCNVPAIMATRTIENRNERLTTMLILPSMSCSARLPIY